MQSCIVRHSMIKRLQLKIKAMSDYEADEYTNDELTKDYNEAN